MGVGRAEHLPLVAGTLARLGARAVVVHGAPGMDEASLCGPNRILTVDAGRVQESVLTPRDLGLDEVPPAALAGLPPGESAAEVRRILAGAGGPRADQVALNAAGALVAGGLASTWGAGLDKARAALANGHTDKVLASYLSFVGKGAV